jgi:hypothetical protein
MELRLVIHLTDFMPEFPYIRSFDLSDGRCDRSTLATTVAPAQAQTYNAIADAAPPSRKSPTLTSTHAFVHLPGTRTRVIPSLVVEQSSLPLFHNQNQEADLADKCEPIRVGLHAAEAQLAITDKFLNEALPGEKHPPKPVLNGEWKRLQTKITNKRLALRACEESLIPNTPVPVTLTLTTFHCLDQSDEFRLFFGFNIEDDEPYALVFAVDINLSFAAIPIGVANSKMTLIGALADVDEGDELSAPANVIWGLRTRDGILESGSPD